jgi:hypothetical protein
MRKKGFNTAKNCDIKYNEFPNNGQLFGIVLHHPIPE